MTTSGQAGTLIAGRYRLERPTGGGTWPEEIWQGFDETLGRPVMIRLLPVDEQVEADVEEQAHSVVAQVARLGHPNIAQVYDVGQDGPLRYAVSEWTGGRTLGQIMDTGPQRWQRAVDWGQQIAEALAALHSVGLADGVLGPETVSVLDDRRVKLTDVGLGIAQEAPGGARPSGFVSPDDEATRLLPPEDRDEAGGPGAGAAEPDEEATRVVPPVTGGEGGAGGTAGADEPTRAIGRPAAPEGAAADVYALGAILWTAIVGEPPLVEPTDLQGPDTGPVRATGAPDDLALLLGSMLAASEQVRPTASVAASRFGALAIEGRERVEALPTAVIAPATRVLGGPAGAGAGAARPSGSTIQREPEGSAGHGRAWALAIGLVLVLGALAAALALWLNHDSNGNSPVVPPPTVTNSADQVSISAAPSTASAAPSTSVPTSHTASPSHSASPSPSASPSASPSPSPPSSPSPSLSTSTAPNPGDS